MLPKPTKQLRIGEAWVEGDTATTRKLCVRYTKDTGAETFGCFRKTDKIEATEFVGLSVEEAVLKFNRIVYPDRGE
jgi:hypothetical protein